MSKKIQIRISQNKRCLGDIWKGSKWKASSCLPSVEFWIVLPPFGYDVWQHSEYCQPGKFIQASVFKAFIGVLLCRCDWLNHWPCGWTQFPAPSLLFREIRLISFGTLLNLWLWQVWWSYTMSAHSHSHTVEIPEVAGVLALVLWSHWLWCLTEHPLIGP